MACIVIAEDSAHIRNVLAMWMARNGYEVLAAPNGREALKLLADHPVALLITDAVSYTHLTLPTIYSV